MKKIIAFLSACCIILSLSGCDANVQTYRLGMGVVTDLSNSKTETGQVDATVAAVVMDEEGRIVACAIDAAQNKVNVTEPLNFKQEFMTKQELGDNYNMTRFADECDREWYVQVNNFASYCIGKTAAEIESTETVDRATVDGLHKGYMVAKDTELFSSCSIQIGDFVKAVVKACNDEQAVTFKTSSPFSLGVAINSFLDERDSVVLTDQNDGTAAIYSDMAAAVVAEGRIRAALTDSIQPKIGFDADGNIYETTPVLTKREIKDDYNMVEYAQAIAEWYQQAKAFTDYCEGKTAAEVIALPSVDRATIDGQHSGTKVSSDETLYASCTIQITGMQKIVAKAADIAQNPLH